MTARASGQHRSAGARLEAFAEEVTNLARANHRRTDLQWDQDGDLFKVHCPFPGPEHRPHRCNGGPQVLLFWKAGQLTASCPKCLGSDHNDDDARAEYTESLLDAVGWTEEQAATPRRPVKVIREHAYFDRDGKHQVKHVKFKPANGSAPGWFWTIAPVDGSGNIGRPRTLSRRHGYTSREFLAEHYQELEHLHHALRWYEEDRLVILQEYDAVVITEGERDADTFNVLMAAIGRTNMAATCLGYNKPKSLASHHLMLVEGRRAVIIGDGDPAGQERAENWAHVLWDHVESVKIIRAQLKLPGTPDAKDLTDWVDARGGPSARVADELIKIFTETPALCGLNELPTSPPRTCAATPTRGSRSAWAASGRTPPATSRCGASGCSGREGRRLAGRRDLDPHDPGPGPPAPARRTKSSDAGLRKHLEDKTTVANVVSLARSNAELVATVAQWDADPWLVATPGGTSTCSDGTLYKANPDDYLTKLAAVAPAAGQARPRRCGRRSSSASPAATPSCSDYLQRVAGYCLTGSDRGARPVLPLRHRRQRQGRVPQHPARGLGRPRAHHRHRDAHGDAFTPARDRGRARCAASASPWARRSRPARPGPRPRSRSSPAATASKAATCGRTSSSSTRSSSS